MTKATKVTRATKVSLVIVALLLLACYFIPKVVLVVFCTAGGYAIGGWLRDWSEARFPEND